MIPITYAVNTSELLNREKWDLISSRYLSREFSAEKTFAQTTYAHD